MELRNRELLSCQLNVEYIYSTLSWHDNNSRLRCTYIISVYDEINDVWIYKQISSGRGIADSNLHNTANNRDGKRNNDYSDVTMSAMASQITSLTIVYSTVYLGTDQTKHQSSA